MAELERIEEQLASDLRFLEDRVLGVLLFGSSAAGKPARDVDVCIVAGDRPSGEILFDVFRRVDVREKRYDVWLFEELPIWMRHEVLKNHRVVLARDCSALFDHLHVHRKLCADLEYRRRKAR